MRPSDPLLDERVARRKFAEAELLYANRAAFEAVRWEILPPAFSTLRVLRHAADGGVAIGVQLELRNYDFLPASVLYIGPDRHPLTWPELFRFVRTFPAADGGPARAWIVDAHASTGLPFLCKRGVLEYHAHLQHRHDRWDEHRGSISLQSVLTDAFTAVSDG